MKPFIRFITIFLLSLSLQSFANQATPDVSPQTTLNNLSEWILKGVFTYDDEGNGSAIMLGPNQQEQYFETGAHLANQLNLSGVYDTYIELTENNQISRVYLDQQLNAYKKFNTQDGSKIFTQEDTEVIEVINHLKLAYQANPKAIFRTILFEPVFEGPRITGLAVRPGKHITSFDKLGLKSQDIITSINGTPVSDIKFGKKNIADELYNTFLQTPELSLAIARNNENVNLIYELN